MHYPIASIFTNPDLLPILVFIAETCVLTLATLRTITIARGKKIPASVLGFFEVAIWLFAVGQVMQNLGDLRCAIAFASGFALGNYLGVLIEQKLAIGTLTVQVTTRHDARSLIDDLRSAGFGATCVRGEGLTGPVEVITTVVERRRFSHVERLIQSFDTAAFYAVHDLQSATQSAFVPPTDRQVVPMNLLRLIGDRLPKLERQERRPAVSSR